MSNSGNPVEAVPTNDCLRLQLQSVDSGEGETGKKHYQCLKCSFSSNYLGNLRVHMRRHTGEKPFRCEFCSRPFSDKSNLNSHKRRKHLGQSRNNLPIPRVPLRRMYTGRINYAKSVKRVPRTSSSSLGASEEWSVVQAPNRQEVTSQWSDAQEVTSQFQTDKPTMSSCFNLIPTETSAYMENALNEYNSSRLPTMVPSSSLQRSNIFSDFQLVDDGEREESDNQNQRLISEQSDKNEISNDNDTETETYYVKYQTALAKTNRNPSYEHNKVPEFAPKMSPQSLASTSPKHSSGDTSIATGTSPSQIQVCSVTSEKNTVAIPTREKKPSFHCQHCEITFQDYVMYTVHMGCHGYDDPFRCNVCGEKCGDRLKFACHFARGEHKSS
uniref:Zinc finger protein Pegasus n=2 Tax=Ciona intestinalis TaxID=7719 RepID=H2XZH8_CIOIN|nr:zinc finger protein Pegasus [Ciona intestinalis]|eukprot:XP_026690171.1 zinc finger protein Pegasus [Ciona intestinalis]